MSKAEIIRQLRKIYSYKEINAFNYNKAFKLLENIKNQEEYKSFYNKHMGKLLLRQKNFLDAEYYLKESLGANDKDHSTYYSLYKVDIMKNDHKEAYIDLMKYQEYFNTGKTNISFPITLLEISNDLDNNFNTFINTDYEIEQTDIFLNNKITNQKALELYQKAIIDFNNKNYIHMRKQLIELEKTSIENYLPISVDSLIKTTNEIIKKIQNNCVEYFNTNEENDNIKQIMNNYNITNQTSFNKLLNYTEDLINNNSSKSQDALELLNKSTLKQDNKLYIDYLTNKLKEKQIYNNLNNAEKKIYDYTIIKGREAYHNNNLDEAYDYYEMGSYITEHPIFDYYKAKILFKTGNYYESHQLMEKYNQAAGEKVLQSQLYLWAMEDHNKKNKHKSRKRLQKMQLIVSKFTNLKDWSIIDRRRVLDDDIDREKINASKRIFFTEEDFLESDNKNTKKYKTLELNKTKH